MDTPMKTQVTFNMICIKEWFHKTMIEDAPKPHRTTLDKQGFTLVEVLVVIAIVAILAIIALPSYSMLKDLAKNARAETEIRMLEKGIALYVVDNNVLPTQLSDIPNATLIDPWLNQYKYYPITVPNDPGAYAYTVQGTDLVNTDYDLFSMGKDGQTAYLMTPEGSTSSDDIIRCGQIGKVVQVSKYDDQ